MRIAPDKERNIEVPHGCRERLGAEECKEAPSLVSEKPRSKRSIRAEENPILQVHQCVAAARDDEASAALNEARGQVLFGIAEMMGAESLQRIRLLASR